MSLDSLITRIAPVVDELIQSVRAGAKDITLGLRRSARLPVLSVLHQELNRPILLLTDRADHALMLTDELSMWAPSARRFFFPEPTPLFYENAAWGESTRRDRLSVLTLLATHFIPGAEALAQAPIIVAPARAVMTRTLPRQEFLMASRTLKQNMIVHPDELVRSWVKLGYEPVNTVVLPGQFARRGGIMDIWPPANHLPARIELFGDEIDTLRWFDPASQRTVKEQAVGLGSKPDQVRLLVSPAREFLVSAERQESGNQAGEMIHEYHIPVLHLASASLLDYLSDQVLVIIDDLVAFRDAVNEIEEQAVNLRQDYIANKNLPDDFPLPYQTLAEIEDSFSDHQVLELGPVGIDTETTLPEKFMPGPRFGGRLKSLMEYMSARFAAHEQLVIVSRQSARLTELWQETLIPSTTSEKNTSLANPMFIEGSLAEGWVFMPPDGLPIHLLTDGEIFGWRRPEPRYHRTDVYPFAEAPEAAYADLQVGDWVVHVDHGIGRYMGLLSRTVDGLEREYLCVEYAENDQLYVPVFQADRLSRYVGPDSRPPVLSRLGGMEWQGDKKRAKEAAEEVAQDLLELYAQRQVVKGYTFSPDTPWQQELEASFPYVETADQLRVISEVKRDMQRELPMDRLICGDVGYGKTEVALRGAFKAVMDGRQVAVLVPTTVLAQQHYNTFRERLAAFPVEVEMLSRFRTPPQQREILFRLANGGIDILIGTHRILQGDVVFKDLGMLIIDEEQRFGVTHKETLKRMRTEVDILTLTATPIPRTLYMALTGVRDISMINTPPEERLPIVTHVGPFSPRLVRQAILRELERGGQIFFVHNRVQTIEAMRRHLEKLVPEARITVGHGQMAETDLSSRMEQFTNGDVDILLSTSIIESGLDIPNANTLIVDRADTFGLAQLYQLRGRVGRGAQRAYAYFFRHSRRPPTLEGRQRLDTIAENTQLGSGYSIAMRDLEIRGAGEILGTRQHGHIAAVGFHLYTRMLADAVERLRFGKEGTEPPQLPGMPSEIRMLVNVDLPLHIGIPASYVPDKEMRLRLYRRIANLRTIHEVEAISEEFIDRFGPPPEAVVNLLYQVRVKVLAEAASLSSVSADGGSIKGGQIVLRYPPLPEGVQSRVFPSLGSDVRAGKNALWLQGNLNWRERLLEVLEQLGTKALNTVTDGHDPSI